MLFAGETVPAHCCILSACSPFFTERLEQEMPPKGHKVMLELRGLKIGTLRKLVDFLYTSEMEVSREEAQEVLAAARQLQVSELESLQLEGGKLVKKTLGRRLNRDCLQLSSPISISEISLIQSPPICSGNSPISWLVSDKQNKAVKLPCTKGLSDGSNTDQKETKKQKPVAALLSGDKQVPKGPTATPEPLKAKTKRRPAGTVKTILGPDERGSVLTQQSRTGDQQTAASLQASKKIKLSRPKLSSPPLPVPSDTKDCSAVAPNEGSKSAKRLWSQKSPAGKDVAKGPKESVYLHGFWSPPHLPKATKRKRSSSESAPSLNVPQEMGQIGRVKLRKVINGSCWEVVQESSATHLMKVETAEHPLPEEGSLLQARRLDQKGADLEQPASPAKLLPEKMETAISSEKTLLEQAKSKMALDEGVSDGVDPCELNVFMLEQLGEMEQYNNLASAGELEHMLDLLLADDDAATEEPEGMPTSCPAPGASNTPLGSIDKEKVGSVEVAVCPQWIKPENSPPQSEQGVTDSESSKGTSDPANGGPSLDTVCGSLQLVISQSSKDCTDVCRASSPQLDGWVDQHQPPSLEKGTARPLPVALAGDEDNGLLFRNRIEASGADTKSYTRVWRKSPLQHSVDYKLPPLLTSLEEEEVDVGGVEELFVSIECVRPDPSPMSEYEVDVLN